MEPPSSSPPRMLLAPGKSAGAAQASGRLREDEPASRRSLRVPSLDERLAQPETREEVLRGRRIVAMPANPPHGDRHFKLDYVLGAHVREGYVGSTDLLTRAGPGSDFATDTCVRRAGLDPLTGTRHLEELAFEVVNEQSLKDVTERAEELSARGVRRIFAVFVKTGDVGEWKGGAWAKLAGSALIEDPCLSRALTASALLDAAEADDAVARALVEKENPVLKTLEAAGFAKGEAAGIAKAEAAGKASGLAEGKTAGIAEGKAVGKAEAVLAVLGARGVAVDERTRATILGCTELATLERWLVAAMTVTTADMVVSSTS